MKYTKNFDRDFDWYLSVRHDFSFSGSIGEEILYSKNGVDGKEAFLLLDSQGKRVATRHPNILKSLLKTKGGVNLHIKMYAEDRASGTLPKDLFYIEIIKPLKCPDWFVEAVEQQKYKYYKNIDFKSLFDSVPVTKITEKVPDIKRKELPLIRKIPKYLLNTVKK